MPHKLKNRLRKIAIELLCAWVVLIGVSGGLILTQIGLESWLENRGSDLAIPGDEVGELEVVSTRRVVLTPAGTGQVLGGLGLTLGSLALAGYLRRRFAPLYTPSEPVKA
jgi:hypothetical protein